MTQAEQAHTPTLPVFEIGGEDSSWHGRGRIEIRESNGGEGWTWRYLTDEERKYLVDCLNTRADASNLARIEALEKALRPFAEAYSGYEHNGYLSGLDFIARQNGNILGHASIQPRDLQNAAAALQSQVKP